MVLFLKNQKVWDYLHSKENLEALHRLRTQEFGSDYKRRKKDILKKLREEGKRLERELEREFEEMLSPDERLEDEANKRESHRSIVKYRAMERAHESIIRKIESDIDPDRRRRLAREYYQSHLGVDYIEEFKRAYIDNSHTDPFSTEGHLLFEYGMQQDVAAIQGCSIEDAQLLIEKRWSAWCRSGQFSHF